MSVSDEVHRRLAQSGGVTAFGLTASGTLACAGLLVLVCLVGTLSAWSRLDRLGPLRWPARAGLLLIGQLITVLVIGLVLNDTFVFYGSWSELFGAHPSQSQPAESAGLLDQRYRHQLASSHRTGHGTLLTLPIPAGRGNVRTGPATVYLPPQYGDPAYAVRQFPVVEVLDGFPGGPDTWIRRLHLASLLDDMIAKGRATPFVAVLPVQNVASPHDTECVNVPGGLRVDDYLTYDVRAALERSFRVSTSRDQWTVLGYSTGGYCASELALRHPTMFASAVSLAGYNTPAHDATTGNLFARSPGSAEQYNNIWLLQHRPPPPLQLLLISTRVDPPSYHAAIKISAAARPPLQVFMLTLPTGGHNFTTFSAELPTALGWLSQRVAQPLAPVPAVDGRIPVPSDPGSRGQGAPVSRAPAS